jgi:hypothetical protein
VVNDFVEIPDIPEPVAQWDNVRAELRHHVDLSARPSTLVRPVTCL